MDFGNFNWRFITNYFFIIILFIKFTKLYILFIWITIQQEIFNKFKKIFISIPCLVIFKSKKSIKIEINILDKNIGASVLQQNKKKYLIAYILKKMISAEFNYNIYDKNCWRL